MKNCLTCTLIFLTKSRKLNHSALIYSLSALPEPHRDKLHSTLTAKDDIDECNKPSLDDVPTFAVSSQTNILHRNDHQLHSLKGTHKTYCHASDSHFTTPLYLFVPGS